VDGPGWGTPKGAGSGGVFCARLTVKSGTNAANSQTIFFIVIVLTRSLSGGVGQNMDGVQPDLHTLGPGGHGEGGPAQAITMAALGIDMQLGRDLGIL
jgi:hypothetical protein